MRVYALLLGIALTAGYAYPAQMAVESLQHGPRVLAQPTTAVVKDSRGDLWYGGVLDPVTVVGDGSTPAKHRVVSRQTVRCVESARSSFRAVS
ncbi:MAG TPA: hypothetical protein VJN39_04990 [Gemmatimonadales bacterium]|nr:hypothetical protein [Gemmatimonadales bacterium]